MKLEARVYSLLNDMQKAILHECDEIVLDFTAFNAKATMVVKPNFVVIGYGELTDEFLSLCINENHGYTLEVSHLLPQDFVGLKGHLGDFTLQFKNANGEIESLQTSQIVSFAPLENCPAYKGVHTPDKYDNAHCMLESLLCLCGERHYTHHIVFEPLTCQYQGRRVFANGKSVCHLCVDICPTMGISSDKDSMLLSLSSVDCIACGKCVSVCPTGSVQRQGDGLESFTYRARLYKGYIPLIVSSLDFESEGFARDFKDLQTLNPLLLPFVLQVPDILNATYLLTLLQESGAPIVLYSTLGEHTHNDIATLNEIYQRIFRQNAIIGSTDSKAIEALQPLMQSHYIYTPTNKENSKDIFSARVSFWIKQESYGKIAMNNSGFLHIDTAKCTLCLSCVEACNTNALINNNASFELLYKASLCTDCGYCVASCAENVLNLESHTLLLEPHSFEYVSIAVDKPFRCVECNKIFATHKSISKIKNMLTPVFAGNALKLKTLECCADCKVKVMFEGAH
ncbi:4Fe-4S dicluster domain-containing protein [Helicobacter mastomyrinus]|uniref:4Fe-4S dicluster domain-containing protein n=1 Tax=Helicobacter mastomyrinus TaxID=287948 RepID=A0ABZ3F5Y2_9HELI